MRPNCVKLTVVLVAMLMTLLLLLSIMFDVETLVCLLVIDERRISTQTNTEYADLNSVLLNLSYGHVTHPAHTFKSSRVKKSVFPFGTCCK